MKKYLVIGNPIEHSLSPKLHNYWIKQSNLNGVYDKKKINESEIERTIASIRNKKIDGINVTVPFKQVVISHLDELTQEAKKTQSVNTIYNIEGKIFGHNTDIEGFERALKNTKYNFKKKKILILGAGGVVPSLIFALKKFDISNLIVSNRTKEKAKKLAIINPNIKIINWGETVEADVVINATSIGLKEKDEIHIDYDKIGSNKFFYDVIYNPRKTNFLKIAQQHGNQVENGKMMFIYQAAASFKVWHGVEPKIDEHTTNLINND